jgi:quercetin dioxygenase-like cupin family protein
MDERLSRDNIILGRTAGAAVHFGGLGARFMAESALTGGGFALVEHPIDPRSLAAPLHTHTNEDEYSFILEGEVGLQVGDRVITGRPGDFVYKPRGIAHAFWNATDHPATMLEIISPAGFERYFAEIAPILNRTGGPDPAALGALRERYQLTVDPESIPALIERYGLKPR